MDPGQLLSKHRDRLAQLQKNIKESQQAQQSAEDQYHLATKIWRLAQDEYIKFLQSDEHKTTCQGFFKEANAYFRGNKKLAHIWMLSKVPDNGGYVWTKFKVLDTDEDETGFLITYRHGKENVSKNMVCFDVTKTQEVMALPDLDFFQTKVRLIWPNQLHNFITIESDDYDDSDDDSSASYDDQSDSSTE